MTPEQQKGPIYRRLRQLRRTYRLNVINSRTFEEKYSLLLTPLKLILLVLGTILFFTLFVALLIAFTPLKNMIPGYPDEKIRERAYFAASKADSLERELAVKQRYLENISTILKGGIPGDTIVNKDGDLLTRTSEENAFHGDELKSLKGTNNLEKESPSKWVKEGTNNIGGVFFFAPIRGSVTSSFDMKSEHYGIDIAAPENHAIKSTLDGTIIFASWTNEWGHVIGVQHRKDLISVYKHNSVLLKKTGEKVKAGDPIAIIGNTGTLTSGPHLHFELWYKGNPVNPQEFMTF